MSVVRINVIEVPPGRGAVLEQRFAARAGEVDTVDGFNSFELLRPTDGTDRYLVVTRWRDVSSYEAWIASESFARSHGDREPATVGTGSEVHSPGAGSDHEVPGSVGSGSEVHSPGAGPDHGVPGSVGSGSEVHSPGAGSDHGVPGSVGSGSEVHSPGAGSQAAGTGSELWSFEVVVSAGI